jgi:hypothetical protein
MLPERGDFREFQAAFAARIRDPGGSPRPQGVPARRMRVYEELLFRNLEGFLLACFPITRQLLGARAWRRTLRRFMAEHRCLSPLFRDIPGEFLAWMEGQAEALFPDRPYLHEFMHYEWIELAVATCAEGSEPLQFPVEGDVLAEELQLRLNPTAQLVCYRYPVHRIGPGFKTTGPDGSLYCYLVYRDPQDEVQFLALSPLSARLLEILDTGAVSGAAALRQVAEELNHAHPNRLVEHGRTLLHELRGAGAVHLIRRAA